MTVDSGVGMYDVKIVRLDWTVGHPKDIMMILTAVTMTLVMLCVWIGIRQVAPH